MTKPTQFSLKEVAPCLFAIFIDILGFGLVAPLLVALFTSPEHNIFAIASPTMRYFYLGLSLSLYPILMFFGTSFIGDLSDIIGRKKTLLFSMMGITIGFLIMSIGVMASSLFLFLIGRGISGLVSASQSVALAAISDLSTKQNKAIHLSYVALIQCIGFVLGPLLGGVLSGTTFYTPFFVASLLALFAFLWIALGFEETFKKLSNKTISVLRFLTVFADAYHNKRVRHLSLVFFYDANRSGIVPSHHPYSFHKRLWLFSLLFRPFQRLSRSGIRFRFIVSTTPTAQAL
jgi:MFS family permease